MAETTDSRSTDPIPRSETPAPRKPASALKVLAGVLFGVLLPVAILVLGGKVAFDLIETGPTADRHGGNGRKARLVQVLPARLTTETTSVLAMGTVKPALNIRLQPRVSGEITAVSEEFLPGGTFRAEERILTIDPTDYDLVLRRCRADLAMAESQYRLELGNQSIAQRESELLGETISEEDRDLILRKPQLESVEATLAVARAALDKARLDLERTEVKAPFNAFVESRSVDLGAQVNTSTTLATLIGTDTYWIEASIPVDQLEWIVIPRAAGETGSRVRVFDSAAWGKGVAREGRVIRLLGSLEEEGRMARLLVAVDDPLGLKTANDGSRAPALLIGAYVRVVIEGVPLDNVVAVDRELLRDGDAIWILDEEGRLEIRPVTIAFRGRNNVLVSDGLAEGERIVTTDLSAPVSGMPLRTAKPESAPMEGMEGDA